MTYHESYIDLINIRKTCPHLSKEDIFGDICLYAWEKNKNTAYDSNCKFNKHCPIRQNYIKEKQGEV